MVVPHLLFIEEQDIIEQLSPHSAWQNTINLSNHSVEVVV